MAQTLTTRRALISGVLGAIDGKDGLDRLNIFANQVLSNDGTYLFPREEADGAANAAYEITLHGVSVIAWSEADAVDLWAASAKRETRALACTLNSIDRILNGVEPIPDHSP